LSSNTNISTFDDLLRAARAHHGPQRLLFVSEYGLMYIKTLPHPALYHGSIAPVET
jgi:hypothetical protein